MAEQQADNSLKLKAPPEFEGERGQSKEWLQKCTLYFTFNEDKFNTDKKKVIYALMLMNGGTAGPWASDFITQVLAQPATNPTPYGTWEQFKTEIRESFEDVDDAASARVALKNLAQGKRSVEEYIIEFKNVISRCGITQFAIIADFFYAGLNRPLREKMFALATMPETAKNMYTTAARLEQQWKLGQSYDKNHGAKKHTFTPRRYTPKERDPDAMDVDRMTTEEREKHYREGRCFNCHEIGHLSRTCPKKKGKQPARKVRTAEVEEEAEEDPEDHQALTANRIRIALEKGEGSKDGVKDALRQGF